MDKAKERKNIILAVIAVILLIGLIVGITVGYFRSMAESARFTITSKSMTIKFNEAEGSLIRATDIEPIEEDEILTKATKKTFSIAKLNDDDNDVYVKMDLNNLTLTDNFKDYDFKWALYQGETKVRTGSFVTTKDGSTSINLANNILLDSTTPIEYTLYIWIQETEQDQTDMMSGTLTGKIVIIGENTKRSTLVSKILGENNKNVITSDPTFSETSTDEGLFVQQDDSEKSNYGFPTYYYRGVVDNNFVKFGTYKSDVTYTAWDFSISSKINPTHSSDTSIMWRIVRINEDGSIRLTTDSNQSIDTVWNSNGTVEYVNSEIETLANDWYNEHITESTLDSKVQYGDYCNQLAGNITNTENIIASFKCPYDATMINAKVGLLTADEMMYSAIYPYGVGNLESSYLENEMDFYSMTGATNHTIYLWNAELSYTGIDGGSPDYENASLRPVITLKADTIVTGSGTYGDPYIVQ